jgi:hypothetical protein
MILLKLLDNIVTRVEEESWDNNSSEVNIIIRSFERDI